VKKQKTTSTPPDYSCVKCGAENSYGLCMECTRKENDKVVYTRIEIPADLWDEWQHLYSGDTMMENRARGIVDYKRKFYVVFGTTETELHLHEVVLRQFHDGPTLDYRGCIKTNIGGGPFFGNNHLFKCGRDEWVVQPYKVTIFTRSNEPVYVQGKML
jgi:hypothetical protein